MRSANEQLNFDLLMYCLPKMSVKYTIIECPKQTWIHCEGKYYFSPKTGIRNIDSVNLLSDNLFDMRGNDLPVSFEYVSSVGKLITKSDIKVQGDTMTIEGKDYELDADDYIKVCDYGGMLLSTIGQDNGKPWITLTLTSGMPVIFHPKKPTFTKEAVTKIEPETPKQIVPVAEIKIAEVNYVAKHEAIMKSFEDYIKDCAVHMFASKTVSLDDVMKFTNTGTNILGQMKTLVPTAM